MKERRVPGEECEVCIVDCSDTALVLSTKFKDFMGFQ